MNNKSLELENKKVEIELKRQQLLLLKAQIRRENAEASVIENQVNK